MSPPANRHPGDITTHPLEDCPVCMELGDWASCEDSTEWIAAHEAVRDLERLTAASSELTLHVITYTVRLSRWLPSRVRIRETWEKVCTHDEAIRMRDELRADGVTDAELAPENGGGA